MSVKDKKRGRPKGKSNHLCEKTIINAAKALMKEDGKIPSIRKLATLLNVDAMAIYHYFSNKNALLEAITTSLIEDIYQPSVNDDWKSELYTLCESYIVILHSYPGLLEILLSMESQSPAEVFIERFKMVVGPLSLSASSTIDALSLLADYLHGFALALNCNQDKSTLDISMLKGPLNMYCIALENA